MEKYTKYICYIFGDDPDVIRIITSFTSLEHFQKNAQPFGTPLVLDNGGMFGFKKQLYRVENQLERSIFEVLKRLHKLDFYESVVEQLRTYRENIEYFIGTFERMAELNVDANDVEMFIHDVRVDLNKLIKRFVYYYFMNIDEETIKHWFGTLRNIYDQFETELLSLVKNFRDSAIDCCVEATKKRTTDALRDEQEDVRKKMKKDDKR